MPEYADKFVELVFERHHNHIQVTVMDQGRGFNWSGYQQINPDRMLESHGRGIAMAKVLSFDSMEYKGNGNQVVCRMNVSGPGVVQQDLFKDLVGREG